MPGFPHIWILADGREVWNAERGKPCSVTYRHGYPYVWFAGRAWRVQRLVLAAWYPGCLDDGSMVRHKVNKRDFVSVWNLQTGTARDNAHDRMRDAGNQSHEHCPRGHLKAGDNLRLSELKRGRHACLSCQRAARKANHLRTKGIEVTEEQRKAWADNEYQTLVANSVGHFSGYSNVPGNPHLIMAETMAV